MHRIRGRGVYTLIKVHFKTGEGSSVSEIYKLSSNTFRVMAGNVLVAKCQGVHAVCCDVSLGVKRRERCFADGLTIDAMGVKTKTWHVVWEDALLTELLEVVIVADLPQHCSVHSFGTLPRLLTCVAVQFTRKANELRLELSSQLILELSDQLLVDLGM